MDKATTPSKSLIIQQKRLLSLIEFALRSARLKLKPVQEVSKHNIFTLYEDELIDLPGVHLNTEKKENEDGEILLLVIERLWESHPPPVTKKLLSIWLDLSDSPYKKPMFKKAVEVEGAKLEINSSVSGETLNDQESFVPLSEFQQCETIEDQLRNYIEKQWKPWSTEEKNVVAQ